MTLLAAVIIAAALDAGTTCAGVSRGFTELNGIYGAHPACVRVVATKAIGTAVGLLVAHRLPARARKWSLVAQFTVNGVAFGWNLTQLAK